MDELLGLAARFASPLYVYQIESLREAVADLRQSLPEPCELYYSLKANPHPAIVGELRLNGCGAEISSSGELRAAVRAGFRSDGCLYTGPAKSREELALAVAAGVRHFSVESAADFERVSDEAAKQGQLVSCLLRISTRPTVRSSLHMDSTSQFGIDIDDLLTNPKPFVATLGARVVGAHFFPLSNGRDEDALIDAFTRSISLAGRLRDEAGLPMSLVDLGGGFAAPYAHPGRRPQYGRLRPALEAALDRSLRGWREAKPRIAFESGRYLAAESGCLVSRAIEVKERPRTTFVLLDSGINHLGGMAGLGRMLRSVVTPTRTAELVADPNAAPVTLVGPLCTPADLLGRDVSVGAVSAGDLLLIPNVGAYGLTASLLGFLSRPAPTEVVLNGSKIVSASRLELVRVSVPS